MNVQQEEFQKEAGSIRTANFVAVASFALLALPGLAGAQSVRQHHRTPQPQTAAATIATAVAQTITPEGVWTPLVNSPPETLALMMLLSDGTVAANAGGKNTWYRLTPDSKGSYVNGTWSQLASMQYSRLYYQSDLLPSGKIYVSGGEYGNTAKGAAELYDPVANTWTQAANATTVHPDVDFIDGQSMVLPDGNVLVYSVAGADCKDYLARIYEGATLVYNVAANTWSAAGCSIGDQDETTWVKLPDNSILSLDLYSTTSERFLPSTNQWISDAIPPLNLFNKNGELGGGFLLPNGKVFYIGGTNQTLIYTPSGNVNPGSWVQGPTLPDQAGAPVGANDAPAAMMANGTVILAEGPYPPTCGFCGPTYFFNYDYRTNAFSQIAAPGGGTSLPGFSLGMYFLDLPDGSLLFSQNTSPQQLYTFKPAGNQVEAGKPKIENITTNSDGSYHVTGTGFNGISAGAVYGDEEQNVTNYPIARLTSQSDGNVYFARTYNWSSTGVATGNLPVSTEMALPAGLPKGKYNLDISANGIISDPCLVHVTPGHIGFHCDNKGDRDE